MCWMIYLSMGVHMPSSRAAATLLQAHALSTPHNLCDWQALAAGSLLVPFCCKYFQSLSCICPTFHKSQDHGMHILSVKLPSLCASSQLPSLCASSSSISSHLFLHPLSKVPSLSASSSSRSSHLFLHPLRKLPSLCASSSLSSHLSLGILYALHLPLHHPL